MAQTITGSAGKASSLLFGSTGLLILSHTLTGGAGLASTAGFGSGGAILQESSPGAGLPAFTIFIGSIDRNSFLLLPSVRRSIQLGSRATASFIVQDANGSYIPSIGADVAMYKGDNLFFAGKLEGTEQEYLAGSGAIRTQVRCVDYGVLCDRRTVAKGYTTITGGFLGPTVSDIVANFLDGTGIWYAWDGDDWAPFVQLGAQLFNHCTVTEAFNQIAGKVNGDWRVDFDKRLWFFPKSAGYMAAPVSIADNDGNLLTPVTLSRSRSRYANRVGVRNNVGRRLIWSDTHEATGSQVVFRTAFALEYKPFITLDSVEQIVEQRTGAPPVGDWDFDWAPDSDYVHWNILKSWPVGTIVISYPCVLSYVHWAEDAAEIAAKGRYELVEEVRDLADDTSLDGLAAGLLERYKEDAPEVLTFPTRVDGFEAGQALSVNLTKPAVSGTLLVQSVDSQEQFYRGSIGFLHTVRAIKAQWQMAGSPNAYFGKLIDRTKQPVDRIAQILRFNVAGTIKGLSNPGLVTGLAEGGVTSQRAGVLGEVRVTFRSIEDGTPITSDVEIDMYQNGGSIFGTQKLLLEPGSGASAVQWQFVSDPQPVSKGDRFTFEVLQADSAAKDGILEINIIG